MSNNHDPYDAPMPPLPPEQKGQATSAEPACAACGGELLPTQLEGSKHNFFVRPLAASVDSIEYRSIVATNTCLNCGLVQFHATNPYALRLFAIRRRAGR